MIRMKKHYAFIPLKDKDLSSFRKSLVAGLSFRPVFALLMIGILAIIGYFKRDLLADDSASLFVFSISVALIIYLIFLELQKLFIVGRLHKSSLMPYIRVRGSDASFYIEELTNGFLVQTQPVNFVDITACKKILADIVTQFEDALQLSEYLHSCFDSQDDRLVNKAVIYIEVIRDQLAKGNQEILATYDTLKNYKEELF